MIRVAALEFNESGLLATRVARRNSHLPRTASKQFQRAWDELDALREAKHIDQETIATENGFQRSTWFEYQRKGTIPFATWERVAKYLGAKLQVHAITDLSVGSGISGHMPDYLTRIAQELAKLPEDERPVAAGLALAAIKEEVKSHPFEEPVAGQTKASRARSK